jgi:hypothetical protein
VLILVLSLLLLLLLLLLLPPLLPLLPRLQLHTRMNISRFIAAVAMPVPCSL